jgi:phenylacetate-CoA ligase
VDTKRNTKVELIDDTLVGEYNRLERLSCDIRRALKTVLQIEVKLTLVEHMSLKRSEGKAKRVIDLRKY